MKKEAVSMRPTETMTRASDGYHSTGTGLEIAFAACHTDHTTPSARVSTAASRETLDPEQRGGVSRAYHSSGSARRRRLRR
jgi:hypothetical protein